MQKTKIDWADQVWNPLTGCLKGCIYCYAKKMAKRLKGRYGYPADGPFRPTWHLNRLQEPYRLKKPQKIFVCSMGDLFAPGVEARGIEEIIHIASDLKQHTFIFLTKNPERYNEFKFPLNAWLGYSTVSELWYAWDDRQKNNIKFVSLEPMKTPLYITRDKYEEKTNFDWLIVGAETGNRKDKYTILPEWIDDCIEYCKIKNIKLWIKKSAGGFSDLQEFPSMEKIIEQYFAKCDFNDECDTCGNKEKKQSYAEMAGEGEANYYICESCAIKTIIEMNNTHISPKLEKERYFKTEDELILERLPFLKKIK